MSVVGSVPRLSRCYIELLACAELLNYSCVFLVVFVRLAPDRVRIIVRFQLSKLAQTSKAVDTACAPPLNAPPLP